MLTRNQEKEIRKLESKNHRLKSGLCLVEGEKSIQTAGDAVQYTFTKDDTDIFHEVVTTQTPQSIAAVARIPEWTWDDIKSEQNIILLDGVQDPGNVGSIIRLCLGFRSSLILHNSADPTNSKVIRSSAGAIFTVPWIRVNESEINNFLQKNSRNIFKLEKRDNAKPLSDVPKSDLKNSIIVAGSEGSGIQLTITGTSISIPHSKRLESLNVTHALAIAMYNASLEL